MMTISGTRGVVVGLLVGLSGIPLNFLWLFAGRLVVPPSFFSLFTAVTRKVPVLHPDADQISILAGPAAVALLVVLVTQWIGGRIAGGTE